MDERDAWTLVESAVEPVTGEVTGPVQAGRRWKGGASCRAISAHSGNSSASVFGSGVLSSLKFGGSTTDVCTAIALDSARNAYVVGITNSTNFPVTPNAYQGTLRGSIDAFLAKLAL